MFELMIYVLSYLCIQMLVVWFIYLKINNPSVVDLTWSIGLMVSGLIYIGSQKMNSRLLILGFLLIIWALRLAIFLWFTRIRLREQDKRYLHMSKNWSISKSLGFFLNFQFQGLLIFIISSTFLLATQTTLVHLTPLDYLAVIIIMLGVIFETLADYQLLNFKRNFKGAVCNQGLWRFSRHPNYFFEWLVWCGFSLFAFEARAGYLAMISPLTLFFIFTRLTGPLTEQSSLRSRGQAYLDYQKNTNFFFLGPSRDKDK